jgi:putative CocE/NonD family hydrolase
MRDGVELSANITLPKAEGRYPVILVRTPYGKDHPEEAEGGTKIAAEGYAYVIQDCRGSGLSDGEWVPVVNEHDDGLDTHQWVLKQRWCNGKIGTMGGSYLGGTQILPSPDAGDYWKAMFCEVPLIDWYENCAYVGGAFQLQTLFGWGSEMIEPTGGEGAGLPEDFELEEAFWHLPLMEYDTQVGRKVQFMRDWIAHPEFDDFWAQADLGDGARRMQVPCIIVSGWYDIFVQQALNYVSEVRSHSVSEKGRKHCHLIVGAWSHGINVIFDEPDFGKNAKFDYGDLYSGWFEYWLKGEGDGFDDLASYQIFVMGRNEWRLEKEWPLTRTQYRNYYFHSGGSANTLNGDGTLDTNECSDEPSDSFVYNPAEPVPTLGGCLLMGEPGPLDQRRIERREDVLVYTSDVLKEDLEVTGPVKVVLYASSDALDTDWTAKLVDVHPNSRAYNLCDGIQRARYREPGRGPQLLEKNKIYRYEIDCWSTSNVFLKGHRIRLEISSSNFPRFDRNPNTGHPFGVDAELQKANQKIFHNEKYPSHIILPVIED